VIGHAITATTTIAATTGASRLQLQPPATGPFWPGVAWQSSQ
jgi:hypothetical protein